MKKIDKDKIVVGISITVFIILLIPLIYIARYNHSCADDYSYGILTHQTWLDTHSIVEVIKTAIKQVGITYCEWQGTFSAVFLMALQPAIFGEQFYGITTVIMISVYILSNIYLFKIILEKYLKCTKKTYWCVFLLILMFSIQFVPYPVESFYWYNGSIFYTFFYSIMLILIGVILRFLKEEKREKKILYIIISVILTIAIGGSNYTTALVCNLILTLITLILAIKKDKKSIYVGGILFVCFVTLMISAWAPGNSLRQATMEKMTEIDAIITSFKDAILLMKIWTRKPLIWLYIFLIPIILKLIDKVKYQFKMPLLFTIITFCIYSAQFTPPVYAQNGVVPMRLLNIIYFSMYWLIIMNITYWLGWIKNKVNIEDSNKNNRYLYVILILLGIIVVLVEHKSLNSYIAIKSLASGEAKQYYSEMEERIKLYEDKSLKDVEVERLKVRPYLLFDTDMAPGVYDWRNEDIAKFYNKNSVKIKESKD